MGPVVASGRLKADALPEGNHVFSIGNRVREHFWVFFLDDSSIKSSFY